MGERADPLMSNDRFPESAGMSREANRRVRIESTTDPEAIAAEIEMTRGEMTQTVDAIQDRLDPERITGQAVDAATEVTVQAKDAAIEVTEQARDAAKDVAKYAIDEAKTAVRELADQAKQSVRASTIGRAEYMATQSRGAAEEIGSEMLTIIRQNPLPAALTAAGLAWLWMQRPSGTGYDDARYQSYPYQGYRGSYEGYRSGYQGSSGQMAGQVQQAASQMAGQAQHTAEQVAGQAQQMAGQVVGQAQEMTGQFAGQAQQTAEQLQYRAKSALEGISADPLTIGALGIAMGAVAALLLPETEQERQLMGDARDRVMDRAQAMGAETIDKVQQVAKEAGKTAMEEAKAQGLTPQGKGSSSTTSA